MGVLLFYEGSGSCLGVGGMEVGYLHRWPAHQRAEV